MKVGSPEWKRFMIGFHGMKEEWLEFYGVHFEFEKMDNENRFEDMMYMLLGGGGGGDDLTDYLLWHMGMTRPAFGPWAIEKHVPFVDKYGLGWIRE